MTPPTPFPADPQAVTPYAVKFGAGVQLTQRGLEALAKILEGASASEFNEVMKFIHDLVPAPGDPGSPAPAARPCDTTRGPCACGKWHGEAGQLHETPEAAACAATGVHVAAAGEGATPPATATGCPCTLTTPCRPHCSCAHPHLSGGCSRCCSYGSPSQRRKMAEHIVARESESAGLREQVRGLAGAPEKLRLLALWIDTKYPDDANPEVQDSLRRWADVIDALGPQPGAEGGGE